MEVHMTLSEKVRDHVVHSYAEPARRVGRTCIRVSASDIAKTFRWTNRFPLICNALLAQSFHEKMGVRLVSTTDPCPSSSTILVFEVV
jgi:hypothetical protein